MFTFPKSIEPLIKLDGGDVWSHLFQYSCQHLEQDDNSIAEDTGFCVSGILFLVNKHVGIVKLIPVVAVWNWRPRFFGGVTKSKLNAMWLKSKRRIITNETNLTKIWVTLPWCLNASESHGEKHFSHRFLNLLWSWANIQRRMETQCRTIRDSIWGLSKHQWLRPNSSNNFRATGIFPVKRTK